MQVFDQQGRVVRQWGKQGSAPGEFHYPENVAFDFSGQILISDQCNHRVQVFKADGTFITAFGQQSSHLESPRCVCVDSEGRVLVGDESSDHKVHVLAFCDE